jgi:hypothetical protein
MIYISHRGNINGRIEEVENKPEYIDDAIKMGYNVEVDVWFVNGIWYLGHDKLQYEINYSWLKERKSKIWVHCKNIEALEICDEKIELHYFWHQEDTVTLTSQGTIWAYPGKQPIKNSIAVMPEIHNDNVVGCLGICSDYIQKYKNLVL